MDANTQSSLAITVCGTRSAVSKYTLMNFSEENMLNNFVE